MITTAHKHLHTTTAIHLPVHAPIHHRVRDAQHHQRGQRNQRENNARAKTQVLAREPHAGAHFPEGHETENTYTTKSVKKIVAGTHIVYVR